MAWKMAQNAQMKLSYCSKIERVSALRKTNISRIEIEGCKKIRDLPEMEGNARLKINAF